MQGDIKEMMDFIIENPDPYTPDEGWLLSGPDENISMKWLDGNKDCLIVSKTISTFERRNKNRMHSENCIAVYTEYGKTVCTFSLSYVKLYDRCNEDSGVIFRSASDVQKLLPNNLAIQRRVIAMELPKLRASVFGFFNLESWSIPVNTLNYEIENLIGAVYNEEIVQNLLSCKLDYCLHISNITEIENLSKTVCVFKNETTEFCEWTIKDICRVISPNGEELEGCIVTVNHHIYRRGQGFSILHIAFIWVPYHNICIYQKIARQGRRENYLDVGMYKYIFTTSPTLILNSGYKASSFKFKVENVD